MYTVRDHVFRNFQDLDGMHNKQHVCFSGEYISDELAKKMAEIIRFMPDLRTMYIAGTDLSVAALGNIIDALLVANTIEMLDIGSLGFGTDGAIVVAEWLAKSTSIRTLCMYANWIGDEGAAHIAGGLAKNTCITHLRITENSIGNRGIKKLCDGIRDHATLRHVLISNNSFDDEGVKHVAELIGQNTTLQSLDMMSLNITLAGKRRVIKALRENTTLQHVYMNGPMRTINKILIKNRMRHIGHLDNFDLFQTVMASNRIPKLPRHLMVEISKNM